MRIDIHSHYISPAVLGEIARSGDKCGTPYEDRKGSGIFVHTPERAYGPLKPAFYNLDDRLAFMDAVGIDRQLLMAPPFSFLYWSNAPEAHDLMQLENDGIAEAARHPSGRFLGFGTVMLQDIPASLEECIRIKKLGLLGVEIGSNVCDGNLNDQSLFEFYARLESLNLRY